MKTWIPFLFVLALALPAASGTRITDLSETSSLEADDELVVFDLSNDDTRKATISTLATAVAAQDAELAALAGLVSAADRLPYFTGPGTASLATFTAFGRSLVDDPDAASALTTLGVSAFVQTILDDVDAAAVRTTIDAQQLDAELTAIAGLTSAAGKVIEFTGPGTAALFDITAAGKALLDDANAAAQLTTLGVSAFAQTILDDADAAAAQTTLGVPPNARTLTAGALLTGGGDLSADRSFAVNFSATQRVAGRNTAGAGAGEEVTASQLLDWIGATRGSVLIRGAAGWDILPPGTSGHVVTSNGAGADPSYQAIPAGGNPSTLADSVTNATGATDFTFTATGDEFIFAAGDYPRITGNSADAPTAGGINYDTDDGTHTFTGLAGTLGLVGILGASTSDYAGPANTTSTTEFGNGTTNRISIPANSLKVGKVVRITAAGKVSAGSDAGQHVGAKIRLGTIVIADMAGAPFARTSSQTDAGWSVVGTFTVRTVGATGTIQPIGVMHVGFDTSPNLADANTGTFYANGAASGGTATIDTTAAQAVNLTWTFGVNSAGTESATMTQFMVEVLR